ncbi:hypothetical protein [Hymenobacter properus]|uniref:DUF5683 domain-containing protein n=1 Tax=Hymenobacter properus TaxID=2791026 RepID=A0A931BGK5_9BACT|nr:hypothetical protein [Hymenobacter properus]MBF9141251.1 hypothetical protein [Hymenobacter properus]MBR7720060.1 hypothetical protein [Microvirga sp. SRT04]
MHKPTGLTSATLRLRAAAATALIFTALASAQAQQAPATIRLHPDDAARGLNGAQHNFEFLPPGVGGEQYQSAGFFGQKLRPYLVSNPEAVAFLNKYRRQKTLFLVDRVVAVGSFGLWGQQIFAGDEKQYFNNTQKVALGVFATSLLATVFINRNTNTYLKRAVEAYNAGSAHGSVWPRLRPTTVGLGLTPAGQPVLGLRWAVR